MNEGALERRSMLIPVSNEITRAFSRAFKDTSPDACDDLASRLDSAAAFVRRLKEALRGDTSDPGDMAEAIRRRA